jgi:hypothetical protein
MHEDVDTVYIVCESIWKKIHIYIYRKNWKIYIYISVTLALTWLAAHEGCPPRNGRVCCQVS